MVLLPPPVAAERRAAWRSHRRHRLRGALPSIPAGIVG